MTAASTPEQLLTAGQLAERWQVSKGHVYYLTRERLLPTVELGRYYRYRLTEVEAFEVAGGTAAGSRNPTSTRAASGPSRDLSRTVSP